VDFCEDGVHEGTILGKFLPLTAEQRAAWRSREKVARFPQTPEEVAIWCSIEAENGRRRLTF
jgi:hypothetical protein